MGPGNGATTADKECAYELARAIAQQGWVLLTGGRNQGVMEAANQGAKAAHGLTLGILPTADDTSISDAVDLAIFTQMGNARNNINVLSSAVVVACGMGMGTASEVALALKNGKPVILLNHSETGIQFFQSLSPQQVYCAHDADGAIKIIQSLL
ncbi:CHP725-containing protein [Halothece sp. PCC 7418]|nr:CHP725-containing protein [Halothece sp. PCC 7418]